MGNNDRNFTLKQLNKHLHGLTGLVLWTKEQSFEQVCPTYRKFRTPNFRKKYTYKLQVAT